MMPEWEVVILLDEHNDEYNAEQAAQSTVVFASLCAQKTQFGFRSNTMGQSDLAVFKKKCFHFTDCDEVLVTFGETFCKSSFKEEWGRSFSCSKVQLHSIYDMTIVLAINLPQSHIVIFY